MYSRRKILKQISLIPTVLLNPLSSADFFSDQENKSEIQLMNYITIKNQHNITLPVSFLFLSQSFSLNGSPSMGIKLWNKLDSHFLLLPGSNSIKMDISKTPLKIRERFDHHVNQSNVFQKGNTFCVYEKWDSKESYMSYLRELNSCPFENELKKNGIKIITYWNPKTRWKLKHVRG